MRVYTLLLIAFIFPFVASAQKGEPVKNAKHAKTADEKEVFVFPDHIRLYKKELNERVEKKTKELTRIIKEMAEKQGGDHRAEVEEAMKLFNNNDHVMVTVTSKKHPEPVTKPIRVYLSDLAKLHYSNVNIAWHNAQYVSNFTRQPNGTYMGIVAVEQEFTGVKAGEAAYVYRDVTEKKAEVIVKVWDEVKNGVITKSYVDVFLGNIGVTEN
jgi:hypothetical protein